MQRRRSQLQFADNLAYGIIVLVLLVLIWTIIELYKGDKRYAQQLKTTRAEGKSEDEF
ncbi:hypothetical protein SAMN04487821_102165 [Enterococcus malodoratus]|nr:hypothetical protein SAMN04487821_102165 [Enterococcus malodoratus]